MTFYKNLIRPVLFKFDPEFIHDITTRIGYNFSKSEIISSIFEKLTQNDSQMLKQNIDGISFENPLGLAAGFDYEAYVCKMMKHTGFGFNTVGTVTKDFYEGNQKPRLKRLVKSESILVNKGFKSPGAKAIYERMQDLNIEDHTVGISIGSTNNNEIDTAQKAVEDILESFKIFQNAKFVKYFELNISCPNTKQKEPFYEIDNFKNLLAEIKSLNLTKPIYLKHANDLTDEKAYELTKVGMEGGLSGFIFSNLLKDRGNANLSGDELMKVKDLPGNFSGRPTRENSNRLLSHIYKKVGKNTTLIGCGGVFSAHDAYEKIKLGANLVQMVTGLIFEGPFVAKTINLGLAQFLKEDGYEHISQAIGVDSN